MFPTPAPVTGAAVRGGRIVQAPEDQPPLDVYHASPGADDLVFYSNLNAYLIRPNSEDRSTLEGDLAESWSLSEDGLAWTFKLRPGIKTHKGNDFDADDVVYNMQRMLTRPRGLRIERQRCFAELVKPWPEGVEKVDNLTVKVNLKAPRAVFPACLSSGWLQFQPMGFIKAKDEEGALRDLNPEEVDGVGPFKFDVSKFARDSRMALERNPNWHLGNNGQRPYLDGIDIVYISDYSTFVAATRTKRISFFDIFSGFTKPDADSLQAQFGNQIKLYRLIALGWTGQIINVNRPPLDNRDIRWAIQLTIDREEMNKLANDGVGFFSGYYFGLWDWIYGFDDYATFPGVRQDKKAEDIAEARRIMESLGYGPSNTLKVSTIAGTSGFNLRQAEVAAEQLKQVYIDVEVQRLDGATLSARQTSGDSDLFAVTFGAEFEDPDAFNTTMCTPIGSRNYGGWTNQEWIALYEQQSVLQDQAKRGELLRRMADIQHNDAACIAWIRPAIFQGHWSNLTNYFPPRYHHSQYVLANAWCSGGKCTP